ncbi:MAG: energy transducer TonB [Prevotellaceae bacterium]|nr:energy transducer TonB [Prevotellaceae bacterium]
MTRNIDITSREWLELIFAGRNKSYGAYAIRHTTSRRHTSAYLVILIFTALVLLLPTISKLVRPVHSGSGIIEPTTLSFVTLTPPPETTIRTTELPSPPAALRKTVRFVVTRIVDDAAAEETSPSVVDNILAQSGAGISVVTQPCDVGGMLDPADILPPSALPPDPIDVAVVERQPVFPYNLMKWIYKELKYPAAAVEMKIAGRVTIQFTVGTDGYVTDIIVLKGVDALLDNEAVRVIAKMPKWIPGEQQGKAVAVRYVLPITFKLATMY